MSALLLWKPGNCRKGCGTADDKKLVKHVGSHKEDFLPPLLSACPVPEGIEPGTGPARKLEKPHKLDKRILSKRRLPPPPHILVGNKVGDGASKWGCKNRLIEATCTRRYHVKRKVYSKMWIHKIVNKLKCFHTVST
ncbi:hypothetical protein CDAR_555571 [Caerostris darwini]|uniref:Uncharacterized protein n=1 Tax=Caerostris darwini TaxID=1538125 RepID=A0AAV4QUU6_9ARAC|nr:hypothetical protein CDAR_555571 [Caerostris darwini]